MTPWGIPRRVIRDGLNVRVEHWRQGDPIASDTDVCELPDRYADYLRDYALAACWSRNGPGQDLTLAGYYGQRWARHMARLQRRLEKFAATRPKQFGGDQVQRARPPRPSLPWNYPPGRR